MELPADAPEALAALADAAEALAALADAAEALAAPSLAPDAFSLAETADSPEAELSELAAFSEAALAAALSALPETVSLAGSGSEVDSLDSNAGSTA